MLKSQKKSCNNVRKINNFIIKFTAIPPPKPVGQNDAMSNHGTGVDWYDFDNDGDFDLLLSQLAHPRYITDYELPRLKFIDIQ